MAGMTIEVVGKIRYAIELNSEDVLRIKFWINKNISKEELSYSDKKDLILRAIKELDLPLFDRDYTETDYETKEINWSEYEERPPEDIIGML